MNQPNLFVVPHKKQGWITSRIEGARMGQTGNIKVRVLVQDRCDKPMPGIEISISEKAREDAPGPMPNIATGVTDENGTAVIPVPIPDGLLYLVIAARLPEGWDSVGVSPKVANSMVVTFRSLEMVRKPIVNTMEIAAAGAGVALFVTGNYLLKKKVEPLSVLGEILVIAAIFERIGRGL